MYNIKSKLESQKTKIQKLSINIRGSHTFVGLVFETMKDY